MYIKVICKRCNKDLGLYEQGYLTAKRKKYTKCDRCGNSEQIRREEVSRYNKIKDDEWKRQYSLEIWLGRHQGFEFIKEKELK